MSNKFRSVEHQAIAIMSESSGKFVGNRGPSFRTSSTSNPDWHDKSGIDVGAARNTAHQDAARKADAESERVKEKQIEKRKIEDKQRQQGTMNMAKKKVMAEGKKTFVPFKPDEGMVKRYMQRSKEDLGGMIDRWSNDHAKNPETDLDTSEKLLAVHAAATRLGHNPPALPQHKNLGTHKLVMGEEISKGTAARTDIENVARPTSAGPVSEKSKLGKQGEIKKMQESAPKIDFGLSKSLIDATRSILEKNTKVELNPETNDRNMDDNENEKVKESKHTTPKTDKEKKLAALAHPKDKITHKDVLVGRGVLAKEEVELTEDYSKYPMTYNKGPMDSSRKTIHTHLDLTKSPDYSSGRGAPTTPERVKKLVREHPKHKEMLAKGFTLSTYGEHKPPTFGKVVKEGVNLDSFSETDLEEMKRSNPFLYVGRAKKDRNRHARKARRTKNEDVEFTAEELERLEAIMHEAKDEREYGYEGEMASSQLRSIIQNAEALLGMIQPDTDFPEWVQSKITLAQDYMLSAKDYMSTEMSEETKLDEARGRPKKTGEAPEGDDTHKHPIQQLSKIGYAIQGSEPAFEHKDGSKTKITKQLARHITTAYNAMRTSQEKDDFATKLHANRDSMMAAVKKHV